MRTVFFGTPELAVPSLEKLHAAHEVAAVVCQPDKPQGRSRKLVPPPVKVWADSHGLPVRQPVKLNDGAFEAWLRDQEPEVCTIAAYGRLLKQPILDVPPHGFINMHPSLLPKYRVPSPIRTAILNGDALTGVTIMRLTLEMDAGDILLQREEPIRPEDDAVTLSERLARAGAHLMVEAVDLIEAGREQWTPQDDSQAVYCSMFEKADGRIRWEWPAQRIHNLVRAALPWPVAHCGFRGGVCRIHKSALEPAPPDAAPGEVVRVAPDRIVVATGDGGIAVLVIQMPGKKAMPTADFLRGARVEPGERFENLA